jgi:signal transduction histidine kinase
MDRRPAAGWLGGRGATGRTALERCAWLTLVCALLLPRPAAAACPGATTRVLFLFSQRSSFAFSTAGADAFIERVRSGLSGCLDDYSESLDAARFGETEYPPIFRDFLARKYTGVHFNAVVAFQRPAVNFLTAYGGSLFHDTPIFFIAGKGLETENRSPGPHFAGAVYKVDLRPTLTTALALQPAIRHIYVVSGGSDFDRAYARGAQEQLHELEGRIAFTYLTGLPIDELLEQVHQLPTDAAIYLMSVSSDGLGNRFIRSEVAARLSAASRVPIYSPYAVLMGDGIVGGSVISVDAVLEQAAPLVLRMLRGEPPETVGVTELDPNLLQFDWRQLRRWSIAGSRLPAGSVILFREPGLWERYRGLVIATLTIFALQTAFIVALVVQRSGRRRAETTARDLAGRLLNAAELERARLARDLHDDVSQEVAGISLGLSGLKRLDSGSDDKRLRAIESLHDRAIALADTIRLISHDLHPSSLKHIGLPAALEACCLDAERQYDIQVHFTAARLAPMAEDRALCLYRIALEALRNIGKHADARRATISLTRAGDVVELVVADDGRGFDRAAERRGRGLGLISIEERVRLIGGAVRLDTRPGQGTTLRVRVPNGPSATHLAPETASTALDEA